MESVLEHHRPYLKKKYNLKNEVEKFLIQIEYQKDLNAFIQIYAEEALQQAQDLDARRDREEFLGPLAGLMLAIKDNILYKNHPVTCSYYILENFISQYNATVIKRILDADDLILGKTNMDEFAMGSSNENSFFGLVKNPHNIAHVAGGSAAALAVNICNLALGNETEGSVQGEGKSSN